MRKLVKEEFPELVITQEMSQKFTMVVSIRDHILKKMNKLPFEDKLWKQTGFRLVGVPFCGLFSSKTNSLMYKS